MRFHEAAVEELADAAEWYESKAIGLGRRFLDSVDAAAQTLDEHPKLGRVWEHSALPRNVEVRRFPLREFPFLIVYALEPELTVLAIAHARRVPGYWRDRAR
jgi:plasmid stabilization system protein ParE